MPDSEAPESREGDVLLGKYRLVKRLGAGGMGEVYLAENMLIGRTVAIKLLLPEHLKNKQLSERFLREARAAVIVRHPNVVDVLDIGEDANAGPFIVQEFLEGEDLDAYIEKIGGQLPLPELAELVFPIVDAVALAHSKGVVHRDLKPGNVFLSRFGGKVVPKLLDFGISQVTNAADNIRMTGTGMMLGSPAYMSPEQIQRSHSVDARTDVWSLGVILYEIIAGRLPFNIGEADSVGALFIQIATVDSPPLKNVMPTVPTDLSRIVGQCLKRDPRQRYPSAIELLSDLKRSPLAASLPPESPFGTSEGGEEDLEADLSVGGFQAPPPAPMPRGLAPEPDPDEFIPPAQPEPRRATDVRRATAQRTAMPVPDRGDPLYDDTGAGKIELGAGIRRTAMRQVRAAAPAAEMPQARPARPAPQPPPKAPADRAMEEEDNLEDVDLKMVLRFTGLMAGVSLAFVVIAMAVPGSVIKNLWSSPFMTGGMPAVTGLAAFVVLAVGAAIGLEMMKPEKREWGAVVSASGLVTSGLVMMLLSFEHCSTSDQATPPEPSHLLPITAALIPLGLCVFAGQKAWKHWRKGTPAAYKTSAAYAALFALGLVLATTITTGG